MILIAVDFSKGKTLLIRIFFDTEFDSGIKLAYFEQIENKFRIQSNVEFGWGKLCSTFSLQIFESRKTKYVYVIVFSALEKPLEN